MATFNGWKRDADRLKTTYKVVGKKMIALKPLNILCPARWMDGHLGHMDGDIRLVGFFMWLCNNEVYAVNRCCALITITPTTINTRVIGEEKYYDFGFEAGDTIIPNCDVVKQGPLVFRVYEEFKSKGYVPAYFSPSDLPLALQTANYYGGVGFATDYAIIEMMASTLPRDSQNAFIHYRNAVSDGESLNFGTPNYIGLTNVAYGTTNAISKFLGNNFKDTVTSALAYPSQRLEPIDKLLRS